MALHVTSTVGTNIKRLRDDLGLSQEALAAEAGIAKYTLQKIEHGANAHGSTLRSIAKALGTTVTELRRQPYTQTQAKILLDRQLRVRELYRRRVALLRQALAEGRNDDAGAIADELDQLLDDGEI